MLLILYIYIKLALMELSFMIYNGNVCVSFHDKDSFKEIATEDEYLDWLTELEIIPKPCTKPGCFREWLIEHDKHENHEYMLSFWVFKFCEKFGHTYEQSVSLTPILEDNTKDYL